MWEETSFFSVHFFDLGFTDRYFNLLFKHFAIYLIILVSKGMENLVAKRMDSMFGLIYSAANALFYLFDIC